MSVMKGTKQVLVWIIALLAVFVAACSSGTNATNAPPKSPTSQSQKQDQFPNPVDLVTKAGATLTHGGPSGELGIDGTFKVAAGEFSPVTQTNRDGISEVGTTTIDVATFRNHADQQAYLDAGQSTSANAVIVSNGSPYFVVKLTGFQGVDGNADFSPVIPAGLATDLGGTLQGS